MRELQECEVGVSGEDKMKIGAGNSKGSEFERSVCKELSRWWTDGARDDVFWRTPQSGGRATSRGKKGVSTAGQYGDVQAIDPIGLPLLEFMTFELKHGYKMASIMDLVDGKETSLWSRWIEGVIVAHEKARSMGWALIVQRHTKRRVICMPKVVSDKAFWGGACPPTWVGIQHRRLGGLVCFSLDEFFKMVRPSMIMQRTMDRNCQ
jgi:hypothetical protein